jgi:flagellin
MADNDVTRIAGNIGAMNALNALTVINKQLSVHQSRLASGKRINSAADDPAGLTIATKMQARSEGLSTALSNIGDAKNLLAVAESGLGRINDILIQMRNKAEAGASDTMGTNERQALIDQMVAYSKQIDDVVTQTKWTSTSPSLIGGAYNLAANALTFQTGVDQGDTTTLSGLMNMSASGGTESLDLANAVATSAGIANGTGALATGASAKTATVDFNAQLAKLGTGSYNVQVDYGTGGTAATVQLFANGSSTAIQVDADGVVGAAATTAVDNKVTVDLSTTDKVINFGNGLEVTIAHATSGTTSGSVDFTAASTDYQLKVGGTDADHVLSANDSAASFAQFMKDINGKLDTVSQQLSQIGALTGRLTFKEDQISAAQINTEGAYNRIMNANMAEEQVNASKYLILQQTATAMLSQANTAPQFLLSLFK